MPYEIAMSGHAAFVRLYEPSYHGRKSRKTLPLKSPLETVFKETNDILKIPFNVTNSSSKERGENQVNIFLKKYPKAALWRWSGENYYQVERTWLLSRKEIIHENFIQQDPDLQRQVVELHRQLVNSQQKLEEWKGFSKRTLFYKSLSTQLKKEGKRLREEYEDSLEREKKLKSENNILNIKVEGVQTHLGLYKEHGNSDGFRSPINGQLTSKTQPLLCTSKGCKGFSTKKEYDQMNQGSYGACCQT